MTRTEKLLRELIALPSVNPASLQEGNPYGGEARVADFLGATAAQAGLDVEFQELESPAANQHSPLAARRNVIIRLIPRGTASHRIILAPHLDTVPGTDDQFRPQTRDGRLFGRGACDTKGSVAAMFTAVAELARNGSRPQSTEILFAGLIDEENAQLGSRMLVNSGISGDLAIVGEPTRTKVVTAHKGSLWLKVETRGRAAHGARPDEGVNAIHRMARVVEFLETDYAASLKARVHPLLGTPTVSVGTISGGVQANIVPSECSIIVDRRTLPGETESSVLREVKRAFAMNALPAMVSSCKVAECLPLETDPQVPLVRRFLKTAKQRAPLGATYFCDASILGHAGIPSVVFGPGDIAQAHTADEWVSLESLRCATAILIDFLRGLD